VATPFVRTALGHTERYAPVVEILLDPSEIGSALNHKGAARVLARYGTHRSTSSHGKRLIRSPMARQR
jgi:hypothetical protein